MAALFPLAAHFSLCAPHLPERLLTVRRNAFSLPGAQALSDYAELLGESPQSAQDEEARAPFSLPALIPPDVTGPVSLTRVIDFGALHARQAELIIECPVGRGRVLLDDECLAVFDSTHMPAAPGSAPGTLTLDLTPALRLGRPQTLSLRFDDSRPAGIAGMIALHTTAHARLDDVRIHPNAHTQTMRLDAAVIAQDAGTYALRAQAVSGSKALPAWEISLVLRAGEQRKTSLTIPVPAERFSPGKAYKAPAVKIQLFLRTRSSSSLPGVPCDGVTRLCGYPGTAARYDLPLTAAECFLPPETLLERIAPLSLCGVYLPVPAPDAFYRAFTRAGIAVRQVTGASDTIKEYLARIPCITCQDTPDPAAHPRPAEWGAWQLCGITACTREIPAGITPAELLFEAAGRVIDPQDAGIRSVLAWLRALCVRLNAEAARQGRLTGCICASGEWNEPDVRDVLTSALAPVHLSALPLCGAWWTGSRFSASLHAFIPEESDQVTAVAVLEDEDGHTIARREVACPPAGGNVGIIAATLPDTPCVLQLTTRLIRGKTTLDQSVIPIYVGARGMLEAAF